MNHRDASQFGKAIEACEQLVVINHQGAFVGQEVLERINAPVFDHALHLVKHLFAPPGHGHVEGIIAVGAGGFIVPHFQRIMQSLPWAREREIDNHRSAASQCSAGAAFEIIRRICAHEWHLKMGMGVNATRHHVAVCCIQFIRAR